MISTDTNLKELCLYGEGRTFKVSLFREVSTGGAIYVEPIECEIGEVKVYRGACGDSPAPGSLYIPYLTAEIKRSGENLEGQYLRVYINVRDQSGTSGGFYIGKYVFSKLNKSGDTTNFQAVGSLATKGAGQANITTTSFRDVLDEVRTQAHSAIRYRSVDLSGSFSEPPQGTFREVLCQIAEAVGGFVTEEVDGAWVIASYCSGSGVQVIPDRMQQPPTYGEGTYTLGDLSVESAYVDMTMGNPLLDPWDYLTVEEAVLTQFIISDNGHLVLLNDETLVGDMAMDVVQSGHLEFTHSDDLNVDFAISNGRLYLYEQGASHNVPCLRMVHTFNGGCSTEIDAEVDTEVQDTARIEGPVTRAIQHFWADQDGAHITEVSKDDFLENPSGGNVLITSEEMQVRQALLALATFERSGVKLSTEDIEDLAHFYVQIEDGKAYSSLSLGAYSNPTILGYQDSNSNGELVMQARGQIIEEDPADSGVWFADIIEDESKILLRRTLSIGQSGHAYETSLVIWDGHIEFSSPEQREALLIGGDGGITSKGDIRGLSFRVSGHNSDIGTVVSNHLTTGLNPISSNGSTFEETGASFTLPAGAWQIAVSVRYPGKSGGIRKVALRIDGTIYYASRSTCGANNSHNVDVQSTLNISNTTSKTIEVMGWQDSDTTLTPSSVYWNCIRIA